MITKNVAFQQWNLWRAEITAMRDIKRHIPEETAVFMADYLAQAGFTVNKDGGVVKDDNYQTAFRSTMNAIDALYET